MAISYYSSASHNTDWPVSGSRTITGVDVGSGDDRILLVLAYHIATSTQTIDGATYNGVSMTATAAFDDGNGHELRFFYLVNPASGSNTLVINASADTPKVGAITAAYYGVNQTTPLTSPTSRVFTPASGVPYSFSQTTTATDWAAMILRHITTTAAHIDPTPYSMTERLDINYGIVLDKAASGTSETLGFTSSVGGTLGGYSFGLVDAGSGGGGIPKTSKQTLLGVG